MNRLSEVNRRDGKGHRHETWDGNHTRIDTPDRCTCVRAVEQL